MDDRPSRKRARPTEDEADISDTPPARTNHSYPSVNISGNARVQLGDKITYQLPAVDCIEAARNAICETLYFPEMFNRYAGIADEHEGTCEWIMDYRLDETRFSPYLKWAKSDSPIFWLAGKPGSGKSVLMRYLHTHLTKSYRTSNCMVFSFWFWEAGASLERSLEGCLRSLVWQCLQGRFGHSIIIAHRAEISPDQLSTRRGLTKALDVCLAAINAQDGQLLFVLDGVDESGPDAVHIIDLVDRLVLKNSNIKICLSSRPEQFFIETLGHYPSLRLQDFNRKDIDKVIDEQLLEKPVVARLLQDSKMPTSYLRDLLQQKAHGVFLWVILAIRSLLRGITNRDDIVLLEKRLEDLPDSLEKLYVFMLSRNKDDLKYYGKAIALYLALIDTLGRVSLLTYSLALNETGRKAILEPDNWIAETVDDLIRAEDVEVWTNARSGGLLEVVKAEIQHSGIYRKELKCLKPAERTVVQFIHRSARTYVLSTAAGKELISNYTPPALMVADICAELLLICKFILPGIDAGYIVWFSEDMDYPTLVDATSEIVHQEMKTLCSSVYQRGWVQIDKGCIGIDGLMGQPSPLPCYNDGTLDYLRICCRLGWFNTVQNLLHSASRPVDSVYASVLMLEVLVSHPHLAFFADSFDVRRDRVSRTKDQWLVLLQQLRSLGANMSETVTTAYGEKVTCLAELLVRINPFNRPRHVGDYVLSPELHNFAESTARLHGYRIESRIDSLYGILNQSVMSYQEGSTFLLGSFDASEVASPSNSNKFTHIKVGAPTSPFLLVQPLSHDFVTGALLAPPERELRFHKISKRDVDVWNLGASSKKSSYRLRWRVFGAAGFNFQHPKPGENELEGLREICNRSESCTSWPEALRYIGKTEQAISTYLARMEASFKLTYRPIEEFNELRVRFEIATQDEKAQLEAYKARCREARTRTQLRHREIQYR